MGIVLLFLCAFVFSFLSIIAFLEKEDKKNIKPKLTLNSGVTLAIRKNEERDDSDDNTRD